MFWLYPNKTQTKDCPLHIYVYIYIVSQKMGISVFYLKKTLIPNSGSKTVPEGHFSDFLHVWCVFNNI